MVYAHTSRGSGDGEPLACHLQRVARLCAENCRNAFIDEDEGYNAGLCHDLGKCGHLFQEVLRGRETKIDHESPGAYWIMMKYRGLAYDAALAIHAHHKGLKTDIPESFGSYILINKHSEYNGRRYACNSKTIDDYIAGEKLVFRDMRSIKRNDNAIPAMLRVRLLLSALCDADYTATAGHFEDLEDDERGALPCFDRAFECLTAYRDGLIRQSKASEHINSLRRDLYDAALAAAQWESGAFSLSAPTGSGKTLAMLGFALKHALKHGKRCIIFVFPYLTLIEQAALEIQKALCPLSDDAGYIFKDHSQAREGKAGFAVPNWNEPIIVTTTIKFFESLFANNPTRVRHLHNIANSVVLFDEAQSMPFGYAPQTLETLVELCRRYNTTVLFSTATQPAFNLLYKEWSPREIVPAELNLFERARRVKISWPDSITSELSWEELADELVGHNHALTILNTRAQAQTLTALIREKYPESPVFHLSTNMCIAHRESTLNLIRARLKSAEKSPCILVSTQCIEAGVDISFPSVYRALGPLDSVVQAFGRCNRNGEVALGNARVFLPPLTDRRYPDSNYEFAASKLSAMIERGGVDIDDPLALRKAFEDLARGAIDEGLRGKFADFADAVKMRNYEEIDKHYHWIDRRGINIIVPYAPMKDLFEELCETSHGRRIGREWLRKAQPISVNVSLRRGARLWDYLEQVVCHYNGETLGTDWFYPIKNDVYDEIFGLKLDYTDDIDDFIK